MDSLPSSVDAREKDSSMNMARILMLGGLAASLAIATNADAQITAPASTTSQTPRTSESADSAVVPAAQLEAGANSYTEGQARSRLEANGFSAISNLRKDDNGFWRATAMHSATSGDVAMDFQGRIAHGAGVAGIGARPVVTTMPTGTAPMGGVRAPDGTPGNPPGTAAGRAVDRTLGTNSTGANPAPVR